MKPTLQHGLLLAASLATTPASAVIMTYTDRGSFEAAAGPTSSETFDGFAADTSFQVGVLDVGAFAISMTGTPDGGTYNKIDVPPLESAESDVNGTAHMRVFTDDSPAANLVLTFDEAIFAFGADFRSLNDVVLRTDIEVLGENLLTPISANSGLLTFFGFTSDVPFTTITFTGLANDVYGIDNVTWSAATAVPEPGILGLLALGLMGLPLAARRRVA